MRSATIQCLRSIFATFGLPEVLVSDNGPNFVSAEFEDFLLKNGVKHTTSAPYHPASNGLAERAVQTVKKGLKKMKTGSIQDKISRFLFSYRNTPQTTTGVAPADLLMKRRLRSPLDLLKPDLHKRVEKEQARQKEAHDKHVRARSFVIGEAVYIKNFGRDSSSRSWLSGHVKQYCGPLSYKVELPDGRVNRRHVDHIRKRYDNDLPLEASAETTSEDLPPTSPQIPNCST